MAQKEKLSEENTNRLACIAQLSGEFGKVLSQVQSLCICPQMTQAADQLKRLELALREQGCSCPVQLDLSLLGETDYYNGIVFGGYISGLPDKVLSGGQYDQLLARMGKRGGAIGFALYLSDLELLFEPVPQSCDTLVRYTEQADLSALCSYVRRENAAGRRVYACGAKECPPAALLAARQVWFDENGAKEGSQC